MGPPRTENMERPSRPPIAEDTFAVTWNTALHCFRNRTLRMGGSFSHSTGGQFKIGLFLACYCTKTKRSSDMLKSYPNNGGFILYGSI